MKEETKPIRKFEPSTSIEYIRFNVTFKSIDDEGYTLLLNFGN